MPESWNHLTPHSLHDEIWNYLPTTYLTIYIYITLGFLCFIGIQYSLAFTILISHLKQMAWLFIIRNFLKNPSTLQCKAATDSLCPKILWISYLRLALLFLYILDHCIFFPSLISWQWETMAFSFPGLL